MEEVIVLQLTLVVKKDVYLLVSGSEMNNSETIYAVGRKFVGKVMDLNDN